MKEEHYSRMRVRALGGGAAHRYDFVYVPFSHRLSATSDVTLSRRSHTGYGDLTPKEQGPCQDMQDSPEDVEEEVWQGSDQRHFEHPGSKVERYGAHVWGPFA